MSTNEKTCEDRNEDVQCREQLELDANLGDSNKSNRSTNLTSISEPSTTNAKTCEDTNENVPCTKEMELDTNSGDSNKSDSSTNLSNISKPSSTNGKTCEDANEDVSCTKQMKLDANLTDSNKSNSSTHLSSMSKFSTINAKTYSTLLVSPKQKGNPLLKFITSVPWEYSNIVPDYVIGKHACALFLSIRYHQLNPDYIHERLKCLGNAYNLRVLLVQIDIADPHHALKHLTRMCILADLTLMLAWNVEEAGKIIETYKLYENTPPDMIMGISESAPYDKIVNALTTVRSINKTDATTLLSTFGTLENIIKATPHSLALCAGFGLNKAERLHKVLHEPFKKSDKSEEN